MSEFYVGINRVAFFAEINHPEYTEATFTSSSGQQRGGLSLLEMMLVLAVLSIIAAISFPALRRNMARNDVTAAARQLQQQLQRARLSAMESAETILFLPEIDSDRFFLGPLSEFQQQGVDDNLTSVVDLEGEQTHPSAHLNQLLPPTRFARSIDPSLSNPQAENEWALDTPLIQAPSDFARDGDANTTDAHNGAVLFYPHGRVQSATITITSDDGYRVPVEIQGLAGRIRVGAMVRDRFEELGELSKLGEFSKKDRASK